MANFFTTVGALEIGTSFSLVLFGIMTMQTYMYWCRFEDDRPAFKVLVCPHFSHPRIHRLTDPQLQVAVVWLEHIASINVCAR